MARVSPAARPPRGRWRSLVPRTPNAAGTNSGTIGKTWENHGEIMTQPRKMWISVGIKKNSYGPGLTVIKLGVFHDI